MEKTFLNRHPMLCVIALAAFSLLPLMALRDFSPSNELRYLSIVDEALANGNVFTFANHGEAYADKPPLFFWLLMALRCLFGGHYMLCDALMAFIPSCVTVLVMDRWVKTAFPGRLTGIQRAAAAGMLMTTAFFLSMSIFVRMDMLMTMWIVLALFSFWKWDSGIGRTWVHRITMPLYIFLALFTKGPVGILMPIVTIVSFLCLERRPKDMLKYLGISTWLILAVLCAGWFAAVYAEGGRAYLDNLLFHQTLDRAINAEWHKAPVWYYLTTIWGVLAPWCLCTLPSLVRALNPRERQPSEPLERLLAIAVVSTVVMLSCFSSKLAIYLVPVIPFAVYTFPLVMARRGYDTLSRVGLSVPAVLFIIIGVLAIVAALLWRVFPSVTGLLDYPFVSSPLVFQTAAFLVVGGIAGMCVMRYGWEWPVLAMSASLFLMLFTGSFLLPQVNDYIGYRNVCSLVPQDEEVYTLHVRRPENMDVYLGRDIHDFGDNADSLMLNMPAKGTLIVGRAKATSDERLMKVLEQQEFVNHGPFAVYQLRDLGNLHKTQKANKRRERKWNRRREK